jgi:hypothetical protein
VVWILYAAWRMAFSRSGQPKLFDKATLAQGVAQVRLILARHWESAKRATRIASVRRCYHQPGIFEIPLHTTYSAFLHDTPRKVLCDPPNHGKILAFVRYPRSDGPC